MIKAFRKPLQLKWDDFSGGVNLTEDPRKLRKNEVQSALNAILRKNGIERRPGTAAMTSFNLASTTKGLFIYRKLDGTEYLLMMNGGKLYTIDKTSGAPTEVFDLTGTGEGRFENYLDKAWVSNGTKFVKVESGTAYQVGIAAPSGATVAKLAGGSLTAGIYHVYISYARRVSSTNVLFSVAQDLGTVELSGSDLSIRISSFANSSDAQVGNKVVWLTEPSGTVTYFYYGTNNNTTTTVDVTNNTAKDENTTYAVYGVNNNFPGDGTIPVFNYICAFDGRMCGFNSNVMYYSLQNTANVYDQERFFPLNKNTYPFTIEGAFVIGESICLNTKNGIIVQGKDFSQPYRIVKDSLYFYDINTVVSYRGCALGLTNDGVKMFDGEKWFDYDISYNVRSEIEKIYSSSIKPTACLYRRDLRTEYHLCYNDASLTTVTNNMRLVLNLNMLEFLPNKEVVAPWELWGNGATHLAVDISNVMYCAQSHASAPVVYKESATTTIDNGIYQRDGTLGTSASEIALEVKTRTQMPDLRARCTWATIAAIIKQAKSTTITVILPDVYGREMATTFATGEGASLWASSSTDTGGMRWDIDDWDVNIIAPQTRGLPTLDGFMVYIKIAQTANDINFNCDDLTLFGVAEHTRFT